MNLNSRTHEQINQSDLHKTPVKPILKCLNSEQYPLLGIFASWETTPLRFLLRRTVGRYSHAASLENSPSSNFGLGFPVMRRDGTANGRTGYLESGLEIGQQTVHHIRVRSPGRKPCSVSSRGNQLENC